MPMKIDKDILKQTLSATVDKLLSYQDPGGHWMGELSSSALATATAVGALAVFDKQQHTSLIQDGTQWLANHQNSDGGWGDTLNSFSNISTTTLCWSAFGLVPEAQDQYKDVIEKCESYLSKAAGGLDSDRLATAISRRYGNDKTFSAPILSMCALSGRLGVGRRAWHHVEPLPFELALLPRSWFKALRLQVVSYALPALIAIGQSRFRNLPPRNPVTRIIRACAVNKTKSLLTAIQPANGGFLEATPLTSFVVMNLVAAGEKDHAVTRKAVEFLAASMREDGSWPIDTNLATWVTTLAINALGECENFHEILPEPFREKLTDWLLDQQFSQRHPYTYVEPGGWGWTNLPGSVPDADDTAGALLALKHLGIQNDRVTKAVRLGIQWLINLQNPDGGIPTFCKGWQRLPFDQSGPDLTAHAISALATWRNNFEPPYQKQIDNSLLKAVKYLKAAQTNDGSWMPLWFGNQHTPNEENRTYGTAKVLHGLYSLINNPDMDIKTIINKGLQYLISSQNSDGAWGGAQCDQSPSSLEETALALTALAQYRTSSLQISDDSRIATLEKGLNWLIKQTNQGQIYEPTPIGFYFAKLWYFEQLYPIIFSVTALNYCREFFK
ncbi:MAG: hypothetical protein JW860_07400 [Sedimentisphaerales bacterium]|nr:hypothetical protein [Sedimentisphaerales bacterium]